MNIPVGPRLIEGKTKIFYEDPEDPDQVIGKIKSDLTAGDGAKHDVLPGKEVLTGRTNANVFRLLNNCGVRTAFIRQLDDVHFLARRCDMIPVEVVVRRVAEGSYLKREPRIKKGTVFRSPVVECYYKTTDATAFGMKLGINDPIMVFHHSRRMITLHHPGKPIGEPLLTIPEEESSRLLDQCLALERLAKEVFEPLERAWKEQEGTLIDLKIEGGVTRNGEIVVADEISCDSWRVRWNGMQLSKQGYRDRDDLGKVLEVYRIAADLTDKFLPNDGW